MDWPLDQCSLLASLSLLLMSSQNALCARCECRVSTAQNASQNACGVEMQTNVVCLQLLSCLSPLVWVQRLIHALHEHSLLKRSFAASILLDHSNDRPRRINDIASTVSVSKAYRIGISRVVVDNKDPGFDPVNPVVELMGVAESSEWHKNCTCRDRAGVSQSYTRRIEDDESQGHAQVSYICWALPVRSAARASRRLRGGMRT
eukprot:663374-Pleurochrysis_carterae.AAC.2